jgi:NodT family efflux transporter outer membrane factor (OMF) lipoprotein
MCDEYIFVTMADRFFIQGKKALFINVLVITLSGCGLIPDHELEPLDMAIPQQWKNQNSESSSDAIHRVWLKDFNTHELKPLVTEALLHNYDLKAAAARVKAAQALVKINGADRFPQISSAFEGSRSQRNSTGGFSISSPISNSFGVDFTLNWELDIWGKLQNQTNAAELDFKATEADYQAARLSLAANVVKFWFDLVEARLQSDLLNKKVIAFENARQIIEDGYVIGVSSALDVRLARANVASAQSQLNAQNILLDNATRSLEILLGRYPGAELNGTEKLPMLAKPVTTGLPIALLRRRPDLLAAEQRLAGTDQRVSQAIKSFLPSLSLGASGGTNTSHIRDVLDYESLIWNIVGNLAQPIFQGGRLIAQKFQADANNQEALANYGQVVLQAFFEVETAIKAENFLHEQEQALQLAATESVEAESLALEEYNAGIVDMITLLESQRRSYDAQSALLQISNQRLANRVNLHLALGGSFSDDELNRTNQQTNNNSQVEDHKLPIQVITKE